jgi:hypothetical protein
VSKKIFKDPAHQELFDRQGFIALPFLTSDEVDYLEKLFDALHPQLSESGFFGGIYTGDNNYKDKASAEIVQVFSRAYDALFIDYTPFGGSFLYKVPGSNSALAVHQDWTIVDEDQYVALNCWVPLCDVSMENGPIMILPGSQYDNFNVVRAPTLPFFFSGDDEMVMKELIPMEVSAGTVIILNQSVIHYSPPNLSTRVRKAITAGIKSKGAPMQFHYKIPDKDELEVFEMPENFFLRFNNFIEDIGKRPYLGESKRFIPYQIPSLLGKALYEKMREMKTSAGFEMLSVYAEPSEAIPGLLQKAWAKIFSRGK